MKHFKGGKIVLDYFRDFAQNILSDKNAIITGARRGIGRATIEVFAKTAQIFGRAQEKRMMRLRRI